MRKNNKITKFFKNIYLFFRFKTPYYLTLITFYSLALIIIFQNPEVVISTLLIILAITIALSQTFFQYVSALKKDEYQNNIKKAGEYMLLSALYLIIITALVFLLFLINEMNLEPIWTNYLRYVKFFIKIIIYFHLTYVADFIAKTVKVISYRLFWKVDI